MLDLPPYHSGSDPFPQLLWKLLELRGSEHLAIFRFKCLNDVYLHKFQYKLN